MHNLSIVLCDGSRYEKTFATNLLKESFLANLEVFNGLFFELTTETSCVKINPRFIVKIEERGQ